MFQKLLLALTLTFVVAPATAQCPPPLDSRVWELYMIEHIPDQWEETGITLSAIWLEEEDDLHTYLVLLDWPGLSPKLGLAIEGCGHVDFFMEDGTSFSWSWTGPYYSDTSSTWRWY